MATDNEKLVRDPLKEVREKFARAKDAWHDDRKRYVDDLKFLNGEQWPEKAKIQRDNDNRPCLIVDKLNQYANQVINDSRQNRPSIKVRPVDSGADIETADIYSGLIKHIEDRSNADTAYDTALECGVKGGFGFFRVLNEYASETGFEQELRIKRIRNPLTVWYDADCQEPDGSDARIVFVSEDLDKSEYESTYPNADVINWEDDSKHYDDWITEKVRIAEVWTVEMVNQTIHQLADGNTATDEEIEAAKAEGVLIPEIIQSRVIPKRVVKFGKTNGKSWLVEPKVWPGKWIPIIPVWGNEIDIDGKVEHSGMFHRSKDAQRLYNYSRSAFAERVALTPQAPYIAADGQVEEYLEDWDGSTANVRVMRYVPMDVSGHPVPPPQRQPAADIPAGFAQDMQLAEHDIQGSLGMYNASLGERSNEKSGKAIMARQREGDVATFHYQDNLSRAIRHLGRILVDLIPQIYDSQRVIRILGMDGSTEQVEINPDQPTARQEVSKTKAIYNLGVGTYDVIVAAGPSYTTRRMEAADAMAQMVQGNPQLFQIFGDLMVKSMDWPMAEEIAERIKKTLPPELQNDDKEQEEIPPQVQAQMQQMGQAIAQAQEMLKQAGQHVQELESKLAQSEEKSEIEHKKVEVTAYDAETKRIQAVGQMMTPEQVQAIVLSTLQQMMTAPDISTQPEPEMQPEAMEHPMPAELPQDAY